MTDGPWAHMGLAFGMSDESGQYCEALMGENVTGPKDVAKLTALQAENSKTRIAFVLLQLTPEECEQKRQLCFAWRGVMTYSKPQLLAMAMFERYGLPVPHSPSRVVCSEFVARVLYPQIDLRDLRRTRFDEVNPNSAWRRLMEIQAGMGWVNQCKASPLDGKRKR